MSKYGNKKVTVDGITHDSKLEYEYYCFLKEQQKEGIVKKFDMQVPFTLLEGYEMNGKKVRPIKIVVDFVIEYSDGRIEVHDPKGMVKPGDIMKKKMFESKYKTPLIYIGKSIIDGGMVSHDVIKEGRKQRKINKLNKI